MQKYLIIRGTIAFNEIFVKEKILLREFLPDANDINYVIQHSIFKYKNFCWYIT